MDSVHQIYIAALLLAALLNIRQLGMVALTAVTMLYLVTFSAFLDFLYPVEVPNTIAWYFFLAAIELSYLICALAIHCGIASTAVAALCGWNILAHLMGAYAFASNGPFYYAYPIVLVTGESCQVATCLLMSRPCMRVLYLASQKFKIGNRWNGWNRLAGDAF